MKRATSEWVKRDRVFAHPDNPNKMSEATMAKLRADYEATGLMPPLIVRSLEESERWQEEHERGMLQLLDGEQRYTLLCELEQEEIEVRIWRGVSDLRAKVFLAILNRIRGEDDKKKRAALLRDIAEIEDDYETLATILPETAEQLRKTVEETTREAVTDAHERAAAVSRQEPLTVFCTPEQASLIRGTITKYLETEDGMDEVDECREGAALMGICQAYADSV